MTFQNPKNLSSIFYWVGFLMLCTIPYRQEVTWTLLAGILAVYLLGKLVLSVGYHRLFCHASFTTSKAWHYIFAFTGVIFVQGSPAQWCVYHRAHHRYSDSDKDPHYTNLLSILQVNHRPVAFTALSSKNILKHYANMQKFVHNYYVVILFTAIVTMLAISVDFVLNVYLPAVFLCLFVSRLHNVLAHWHDKARNWWLLELLVPSMGEWLHKNHHDYPGHRYFNTAWYHLDLGGILIKLIKK